MRAIHIRLFRNSKLTWSFLLLEIQVFRLRSKETVLCTSTLDAQHNILFCEHVQLHFVHTHSYILHSVCKRIYEPIPDIHSLIWNHCKN